jgi:hypothetical protein
MNAVTAPRLSVDDTTRLHAAESRRDARIIQAMLDAETVRDF